MKIELINKSKHAIPQYETPLSAGVDLRANIDEAITLKPLQRALVKTGLFMAIPAGYEAQVRPRSGLAFKKGITVLNSPGTIDSDYRGEICIIAEAHKHYAIKIGDRIAQGVLAPIVQADFEEVEELTSTDRGDGGFGSTGK